MNIFAGAAKQLQRQMKLMGETIVLKWRQVSGGTVDPTTGARLGGTATDIELAVKAFVYTMDEGGKARMEKFVGVLDCDYVVDVPPDLDVEGKAELIFEVRGIACQQAKFGNLGGNKPYKDVEHGPGGVHLYRTLYLQTI